MDKEPSGRKRAKMTDTAKKKTDAAEQKRKAEARRKAVEYAKSITEDDMQTMLETMEIDVERAIKSRL